MVETLMPRTAHRAPPAERQVPDLLSLQQLLGLRSTTVTVVFAALVVGDVAVLALAAHRMWGAGWWLQVAIFLLLATLTAVNLRVPGDPTPLGVALASTILAPSLTMLSWWTLPADLAELRFPMMSTAGSMCALTAGLMVMRGRPILAWIIAAALIGIAMLWGLQNGGAVKSGLPLASRVIAVLVPATAVAVMIRPMVALMGALRDRELAAVRAAATVAARDAERADRLDDLSARAGAMLERIAAGEASTIDDVDAGRRLENQLRDEVRGRGWIDPQVSEAVDAVRAAGGQVTVFDDSGLGASSAAPRYGAADLKVLREALLDDLRAATWRSTITARILPAGREIVASITVDDGHDVVRRVCREIAGELVWSG
ncbi:MAG: hypothetical protein QM658_08280 [Gordonia sp. (in: high G+C Gram-positive bacteria)]